MSVFEEQFEDDDQYYPREDFRRVLDDAARASQQADADNRLLRALAQGRGIDHAALKQALKDGANPNRMLGSAPATHIAVMQRDLPALEMLVNSRANLQDVDDRGYTALDAAAAIGFRDGIKLLAFADANFYKVDENEGFSPYADNYQKRVDNALIDALRGEHASRAQAALALGASPEARMWDGLSALHLAVVKHDHDSIRALAAAGVDMNAKSSRDESTLGKLWWARSSEILSPQWHATADLLKSLGTYDLLFKSPLEMDGHELMQPPAWSFYVGDNRKNITPPDWKDPPKDPRKPAPALHYMIYANRVDEAVAALKKSGVRLKASDLTDNSRLLLEPPLDLLRRRDQLGKIFVPALWQGRAGDMRKAWDSVKDRVDERSDSFFARDFEIACARVREQHLRSLSVKASRFRLGHKP